MRIQGFPDGQPRCLVTQRAHREAEPEERPAPVSVDVEIPWRRILSLEFAVLDFGDRRRHRYAYRISGRHEDWVELGSRREITFTDLDPGRYALSVRGRNDQGVWTGIPVAMAIHVVPPFWMTALFRALAAAAIVGIVLAAHHLRTAALERRNRQLVLLKDEREHALHDARASCTTRWGRS